MGTDWKRALVALTATVMTVAIVAGMYWARPVLIPVALAVFLTFVLSPLVTRLQRFKLGRPVEVLLAVGLLVAVTGGVGGLIVSEVAELADTLPDRREAIKGKLVAAKSWVIGDGGGRYTQLIDDLSEALTPDGQNKRPEVIVASAPTSFTERAEGYFHPAVEALGAAALTFILTLFMLLKREDLRNRAISLIGHGRVTTTTKAVDDASQRISKYLVSQLTLNASFGLLIAGGLFALGVEHAILWGFIAGLMRYVPYAGIWIGMLPPLLFSVATAPEWGGGWGEPLSVLGLFVVLETLSANFIEPKVYGHSTGVSEVAQLIAAAMWAFLWGPIGLILSGPLTVCLLVLGRHVTQFNFFVVLLGDQPALEPKVSFYQRLAARDQDEASDIAMEAARESGPDAALDEVIVPALCMARRDSVTGDLDPKALAFAVRAASEIAEEVAEADRPAVAVAEGRPALPEARLRLLVCPTRDDAEHAAARMFALTVDRNQWEVKVAADETLASEVIGHVESFQPDAIVVGTLPPGGVAHARYLVTRLHRQFPELKVLVGRWGASESLDPERDDSITHADSVDHSFADTRKRLASLYPVLAARESREGGANRDRALVGTTGA